MGAKWIKNSVLYFAIGLAFGLFMYYAIDLQWKATHAHINLVGWLSVIYSVYKEAAETSLTKVQFWLYNIGLSFLFVGMMMIYLDVPSW